MGNANDLFSGLTRGLPRLLRKRPHHARDPRHGAPPFIISEAEVDELVAKAKAAIDKTAKDYGKM